MSNPAELIPVIKSTIDKHEALTCDARELHTFLGVRRDFSNWIKGRIEKYDFTENQDFVIFAKSGEKPRRGRHTVDYTLTVDMAKQLAMVENNEKGRTIRRYFIECERRAREANQTALKALPTPEPEPQAKKQRVRKVLPAPAPNSIEAQINALIEKVHFYIREISEVEKLVSALMVRRRGPGTSEVNKAFYDFTIHAACTTSALWAALDFNLRAIEDSIKTRLAIIRA